MEQFIKGVENVNGAINSAVWGWPALILLGAVGIIMTLLTKFFQVGHIKHWLKNTIGAIFKDKHVTGHTGDKSISQFQSLCTALAATVGTGNIVGVAGAIAAGGPGAVFWMWIIAFFGMMTNYSENVLGILYRRKGEKGEWHGGAMYYLRDGLGAKKGCKVIGIVLAILFSIFCLLASFGIGNMSQVNSMSSNIKAAITNVATSNNSAWTMPAFVPYLIGGLLFIAVAAVILGGLKRIAAITEKLVPFMVVVYFIGALVIILMNVTAIPSIFKSIFKYAFTPTAAVGGTFGAIFKYIVDGPAKMGFKRGVFSNEAGLGSSVMVHSSSNVKEPVRQGMWGIFEVFADTIIVCTLTAIVILGSGVIDLGTGRQALADPVEHVQYVDEAGQPILNETGEVQYIAVAEGAEVIYTDKDGYKIAVDEDGLVTDDDGNYVLVTRIDEIGSSNLMSYSFSKVFGPAGSIFIALAILLFAYSTVLGWSHYGTTAVEYLFGKHAVWPYRIVFVIIVFLGAIMEAKLAWDISDTFNGLMMIPNLIGVLVLSPMVMKATKNYVDRNLRHKDIKPMLSVFDDIQAMQEKALKEHGDEE